MSMRPQPVLTVGAFLPARRECLYASLEAEIAEER